MSETKRLLIIYAHPDDESFGLGAFIARYVAEGVEVSLVCGTNGEAGTVSPEHLNGYSSIAELRLAELDCASAVLGFKEVIKLGYRDSGMMHNADNDNPASLWQAPTEAVAAQLVEVIRRLQPQVVITFDPYGGYGHPDHIKMHLATHAAFEMLKDDPARPQKLYYSVFPKELLQVGVRVMRLRGQDPRKMGRNGDMDFVAVLENAQPVTALIDVGDKKYREVGEKAAACHASQISPRAQIPFFGMINRALTAKQRFCRVIPPVAPGEPLEYDLFHKISLDSQK
jgi:LmbE family N-acetylglucosaminyl deacetylase